MLIKAMPFARDAVYRPRRVETLRGREPVRRTGFRADDNLIPPFERSPGFAGTVPDDAWRQGLKRLPFVRNGLGKAGFRREKGQDQKPHGRSSPSKCLLPYLRSAPRVQSRGLADVNRKIGPASGARCSAPINRASGTQGCGRLCPAMELLDGQALRRAVPGVPRLPPLRRSACG